MTKTRDRPEGFIINGTRERAITAVASDKAMAKKPTAV